ncbi:hypothetical protein ACWGF3_10225 [Streptomyces xanthophaeus]
MVGQIGSVSGEEGVLDEGDGGDQGAVAHVGVVMTENAMNCREDRRACVPERPHLLIVNSLTVVVFVNGNALVVGVVGGVAEPVEQLHESRAVRCLGAGVGLARCDGRIIEERRDAERYWDSGLVDAVLVSHGPKRIVQSGFPDDRVSVGEECQCRWQTLARPAGSRERRPVRTVQQCSKGRQRGGVRLLVLAAAVGHWLRLLR